MSFMFWKYETVILSYVQASQEWIFISFLAVTSVQLKSNNRSQMPNALVEQNHHQALVQRDMASVITQRSGFKKVEIDFIFYHANI